MFASFAPQSASYPSVTSLPDSENRNREVVLEPSEAASRLNDADADVWPWVRLPDGRLELGLEVA